MFPPLPVVKANGWISKNYFGNIAFARNGVPARQDIRQAAALYCTHQAVPIHFSHAVIIAICNVVLDAEKPKCGLQEGGGMHVLCRRHILTGRPIVSFCNSIWTISI